MCVISSDSMSQARHSKQVRSTEIGHKAAATGRRQVLGHRPESTGAVRRGHFPTKGLTSPGGCWAVRTERLQQEQEAGTPPAGSSAAEG